MLAKTSRVSYLRESSLCRWACHDVHGVPSIISMKSCEACHAQHHMPICSFSALVHDQLMKLQAMSNTTPSRRLNFENTHCKLAAWPCTHGQVGMRMTMKAKS